MIRIARNKDKSNRIIVRLYIVPSFHEKRHGGEGAFRLLHSVPYFRCCSLSHENSFKLASILQEMDFVVKHYFKYLGCVKSGGFEAVLRLKVEVRRKC